MNVRFKVPTAKCNLAVLLLALLAAGEAVAQAPEQWLLMPEPKFMKPEISLPIENAQRTVLAPAVAEDGDVRLLTKAEFDRLGVSWAKFQDEAAANADRVRKSIEPRFVRKQNNVIDYAVLESDQPLTASVLLAPGLGKQFRDTFGAKILVVVPNRFTVFIFPSLAGHFGEYAPMILRAFRETPYPVSIEVFEVSSAGLRAAGVYQEP